MISRRIISFLKCIVLPIALYLLLFNPLYSDQDQTIRITVGSALFSIFISLVQLATALTAMVLIHRMSLAETGLFSFSCKTMLKIVPSMFVVWIIYMAGVLAVFLMTGTAEDPGIITIELSAPVWLMALMMLCVGYCEETFFRIYLVGAMEPALGKKGAILLSAVLFALGHLYQGYLATAIIFFLGLGFQWIYSKYRSIHVNAMTHAIFDVISVLIKGVA